MEKYLPPAPTRPLTDYYTTHEVKARGWSGTMINKLMPRANAARKPWPRPGVIHRADALVHLYLRERVEEEETTEDFLITGAAADKAKARGASNGATRTANNQARIAEYVSAFKPRFTWAQQPGYTQEGGCYLEVVRWERRNEARAAGFSKQVKTLAHQALLTKCHELFARKFPQWQDPNYSFLAAPSSALEEVGQAELVGSVELKK